ncbi:MAG: hypothetical protein ACK4ND_00245 [Cytophagaceae bacterium]
MHKVCIWILLFLFFAGCSSKRKKNIERGFYYWRSNFQLTDNDQSLISSLDSKKIYVKFFDVVWDEDSDEPMPVATIRPKTAIDTSIKIVPTVFITNATFQKLQDNNISTFRYNVFKKISELTKCFGNSIKYDEIQIDCDWNESTREKYFRFLQEFKKNIGQNIRISATIRLHQVKYFEKTGVPPVDRGMLMFYNMGRIDKYNKENSIFNESEARKYLINFNKYPLPLDVALPIFSWAAVYRDGSLINLISDFEVALKENNNLTPVGSDTYKVMAPVELKSFVAKQGDIIKFEVMDVNKTRKAANLIKPYIKDSISVVLYDFNPVNLKRYNEKDLESIYNIFN